MLSKMPESARTAPIAAAAAGPGANAGRGPIGGAAPPRPGQMTALSQPIGPRRRATGPAHGSAPPQPPAGNPRQSRRSRAGGARPGERLPDGPGRRVAHGEERGFRQQPAGGHRRRDPLRPHHPRLHAPLRRPPPPHTQTQRHDTHTAAAATPPQTGGSRKVLGSGPWGGRWVGGGSPHPPTPRAGAEREGRAGERRGATGGGSGRVGPGRARVTISAGVRNGWRGCSGPTALSRARVDST